MERIAFALGFLLAFAGMWWVFKEDVKLKREELIETKKTLKSVRAFVQSALHYLSAGDVERAKEILSYTLERAGREEA